MGRHPHDLHAYALGDLTGAAEDAARRHVATCRHCRDEVRQLRADHAATIDGLPPVAPSRAARERALAAARAAMADAASAMTEVAPSGAGRIPTGRGVVRAYAWAGWALACVIAVAAIGVGWERHTAWRTSEADRSIVAGWLTRDDVTTWPLAAEAGARSPGSIMVADDGVVLIVMRAPAPVGAAYRAWGVTHDGATALGDVPRTVLRVPAATYDEVVVSLEPRRATAGPTDPLGAAPIAPDPPPP